MTPWLIVGLALSVCQYASRNRAIRLFSFLGLHVVVSETRLPSQSVEAVSRFNIALLCRFFEPADRLLVILRYAFTLRI